MTLTALNKARCRVLSPQNRLIMKLTVIFLLCFNLASIARIYSQTVTLHVESKPLKEVFTSIEKQTGYFFFYDGSILRDAKPITATIDKKDLEPALQQLLAGQSLSFSIKEKTINVFKKTANPSSKAEHVENTAPAPPPTIHGRIVNEKGEPVAGVNVSIKGGKVVGVTNDNGEFTLTNVPDNTTLVFSAVSVETFETKLNGRSELAFTMKAKVSVLDEVQMIAYGSTTKRLNTGNVATVKSDDIEKQPVSNPLAALEGRVPGLLITQSNGLPGSAFKVQLRGQSSIGITPSAVGLAPTNPLFIIDGMPFAAGNTSIGILGSILSSNGGVSPFSSINPADIESIDILKDADATAIYGSRGANGVVLITTKKGKAGKTKFNTSVYSGVSSTTRTINWLNTQQYLTMRRQAFANDASTPTLANAPDLLAWDTTRYTDLQQLLINGTANVTDVQSSVSGGNLQTQFLIGGGYHRETTTLAGPLGDNRGSLHLSLSHSSEDKRFNVRFTALYSSDLNKLVPTNPASSISLPPDIPTFYDSVGNLVWSKGGATFANPMAAFKNTYEVRTENLLGNMQLSYLFGKNFTFRTTLGYNSLNLNEIITRPSNSTNPALNPSGLAGSSEFGSNRFSSWNIEPQLQYNTSFLKGRLEILAGGTIQQQRNETSNINVSGYSNDALLRSLNGGTSIVAVNSGIQYKYAALFARINYNWDDKYIVNLTGRRDGSSRFGPNNKYGNFGALGAAWLFSNEKFIKNSLSFLSFGKIRASYGSTGNDQIGDYKYLDSWTTTTYPYQTNGLYPNQLSVADFSWEKNVKLEAAVDLGLLNNRILLSIAVFRNQSSNQLIAYKLPTQTGFASLAAKNFPAVVQNTGLELSLQTKNVAIKNFSWNSIFTLTVPKNKLVSFPGLASSSYASFLIEGQSLSIKKAYHYTGVDPTTGVFTFLDVDKDGKITTPNDQLIAGNLDPKYYGGFQNDFTYKGFQLSIFFEFRNMLARNYLSNIYVSPSLQPGFLNNQPDIVLNRWQKPGDVAEIQRVTMKSGTAAYAAATLFNNSDGTYSDASFVRLKNVYLSYAIPEKWQRKLHLQNCRIYVQGQNLLVFTKYKGADPETQNIYSVPPMKTFAGGIQLTF